MTLLIIISVFLLTLTTNPSHPIYREEPILRPEEGHIYSPFAPRFKVDRYHADA